MRRILVILILALSLTTALAITSTAYDVTIYRNISGIGYGINDSGNFVGTSTNNRAFLWDGNSVVWLESQNRDSYAYSINNSGTISGRGYFDLGDGYHVGYYVAVWNSTGQRFTGLIGGVAGAGCDINDSGNMAIWMDYPEYDGMVHAQRWGRGHDLVFLGGKWFPKSRWGYGINDLGQVVGCAGTVGGNMFPMWWDSDGLANQYIGWEPGCAYAINNSSLIVGEANGQATLWYTDGTKTTLASLGGRSCAQAINDAGIIAGWAFDANGREHAVVWDLNGNIIDLANAGWASSRAYDINENGQIIGFATGQDSRGSFHSPVVWTMVPEPSSLLVLLLGLGGVAGILRRRK